METNVASNPGVPRKRIEYQYDSESRRIARAELVWSGTSFTPDPAPVRYIWKGWNLLAEGITSGSTIAVKKSYLWGLDLSETLDQTGNVGNLLAMVDQSGASTVNLLPSYDGNGNIIALSHAGTGQRIASYEYDAFGQRVVSTNHAALLNQAAAISTAVASNRWGFSTKQEDASTGLLYYGYRYYDPVAGRWASKDPIGERGGINLYGFVTNDGLNKWDILGLKSQPKLSYSVDKELTRSSYCGDATWTIKWIVSNAGWTDGMIVQHVETRGNMVNCANNYSENLDQDPFTEYWLVKSSMQQGGVKSTISNNGIDQFIRSSYNMNLIPVCTKGKFTITATAQYVDGGHPSYPARPDGVKQAGGLIAEYRIVIPLGGEGYSNKIKRVWTLSWDCCKGEAYTEVSYK